MSEYMDVEMDGKSDEEFAEEVCNALKSKPNLANMMFVRTGDCVTAKDINATIGGSTRFRFYTDQGRQRRYIVDGNSKTRPLHGLKDAVDQVLQAI